jgi:hypothetical protein
LRERKQGKKMDAPDEVAMNMTREDKPIIKRKNPLKNSGKLNKKCTKRKQLSKRYVLVPEIQTKHFSVLPVAIFGKPCCCPVWEKQFTIATTAITTNQEIQIDQVTDQLQNICLSSSSPSSLIFPTPMDQEEEKENFHSQPGSVNMHVPIHMSDYHTDIFPVIISLCKKKPEDVSDVEVYERWDEANQNQRIMFEKYDDYFVEMENHFNFTLVIRIVPFSLLREKMKKREKIDRYLLQLHRVQHDFSDKNPYHEKNVRSASLAFILEKILAPKKKHLAHLQMNINVPDFVCFSISKLYYLCYLIFSDTLEKRIT